MFEASSYFILYEIFLRVFSPIDLAPYGGYSLLIVGGTALLMASFAVILRRNPSKSAQAFLLMVALFGIAALAFFLIILFNLTHQAYENWMLGVFGVELREAYVYPILFVSGMIALSCFIASRFASREANRDSKLALRQKLQTVAVVASSLFLGVFLWNWFETAFIPLVIGIFFMIELGSLFYWLYDPFIYLLSKIVHPKPKPALEPTPDKLNQFAILVCAHNEMLVIENLISSLYAMDYPRNKYSIYVVCDNCRDETAEIVRENGAIALVRDDLSQRGKHKALRWAFEKLAVEEEQGNHFDAYVILNADNLVNENYLSEVNTHLNQGHEVMQTYLTSKNPEDSWVSECSSIGYWLGNSNYQDAHSRMNLSAQLKGSGMVLRSHLFKEITWDTNSLAEEQSFAIEYLLKRNVGCHWVHHARFYDERPITLKASLKQRTRWMQGHLDSISTCVPRLFASGIRNLSFKQIDMALYLLKPLFVLASLIVYSTRLFFALLFPASVATTQLITSFPLALVLALVWLCLHLYTLHSEGRLRSAVWIPVYYLYTCTWCVPIFRGFVKRHERFWVSTFHARDLAIDDITEDAFFNEARRRLAGLENLHQLPLGQILLKAAIITGHQLEAALSIQSRNGGYLGNILIDNGAISEDILATYLNIQQTMRTSVKVEREESRSLHLGQILLDAELLTANQLQMALDHQKVNGCKLGEAVIDLQMLSEDELSIFLEVQNMIGANYIDEKKAHEFLQSVSNARNLNTKGTESFLLTSGLISKQQLEAARAHQKIYREGLVETLLFLGYLTPEQVNTLQNVAAIEEF